MFAIRFDVVCGFVTYFVFLWYYWLVRLVVGVVLGLLAVIDVFWFWGLVVFVALSCLWFGDGWWFGCL